MNPFNTEPQEPKEPHETHEPVPPKHRFHFRKRWLFFGTLATIFLVAYCAVHINSFSDVFKRTCDVISPLIIGCIIAYFCNPILKFYEYVVFRKLKSKSNIRSGISLLFTILSFLGLLAILVSIVLPELVNSIKQLIANYEFYLNGLLSFVQSIINRFRLDVDISDMQKLTDFLRNLFGEAGDLATNILNKLQSYVLDTNLLGDVWGFLSKVFSTFLNIILGLFIAIYILSSKEKRVAQINKFRAAFLSEKQNKKFSELCTLVDKTFGGYFKGVLLDAVFVGILMLLLLSIFHISQYNLLIAAICAITNIIPVFGPYIGAVPSCLIVLITNPENLLWFILIVVIVQQIDGNILVPLIQGNNTGISSLAVLVSITLMGGFFGVGGMIIGVPVFAVIIELCKRAIEERLVKAGKVTDTTHYYRKEAIGNAEKEVYYEHAHWKYQYDHSRLKPHIDKLLATILRIGKKKKDRAMPSGEVHTEPSEVTDTTEPTETTVDSEIKKTAESLPSRETEEENHRS